MARIGVQAMMLRDHAEEHGVGESLRRVSELGYRAVEVSQIPMTAENVAAMDHAQQELGIEIAALSASYLPQGRSDSLSEDLEKVAADCERLGVRYVRIGMAPLQYLTSAQAVADFCAGVDQIAEELAHRGVRLYYHNHHIEYARIEGRTLLDLIYESAPNLGLEVDVHWVQRGGGDPVRALHRYGDRTELVHLKDYRVGLIPPDVIEARAAGDTAAWGRAWKDLVQFAEVGEGTLDFPGIIDTALQIGVQYMFVEQDEFYGRDVFECLRISRDNLIEMGYGHLF
ncbi:MAG TPA: sugar phosphate isomerase/epimerase [Beutenbergiaceae bacterium]|nr:sugar phosphate isomerase/epimerase [Beutenbergiaceae bacterium]